MLDSSATSFSFDVTHAMVGSIAAHLRGGWSPPQAGHDQTSTIAAEADVAPQRFLASAAAERRTSLVASMLGFASESNMDRHRS
jgi:hypothetical protein